MLWGKGGREKGRERERGGGGGRREILCVAGFGIMMMCDLAVM